MEDAITSGVIWEGTWRDLVHAASGHTLHFVGLLSDGNVHSNISHLQAMIEHAVADGVTSIAVHPLFDGRDVSDHTAEQYLRDLESCIEGCRAGAARGDAPVGAAPAGPRRAAATDIGRGEGRGQFRGRDWQRRARWLGNQWFATLRGDQCAEGVE